MAGRGITTREIFDPTVNAVDGRSTRAQFSQQVARLATRDFATPEALRVVLQTLIDQQAALISDLSTLPFLGGVFIVGQRLTTGATTIGHGLDGLVDVMVTLPNASAIVILSSQDSTTRTIVVTASATCTVSLLIYPKKRGK
jgi:hypothetical protein